MSITTTSEVGMKTRRAWQGASLALVLAAASLSGARANAAELQQKWVAGQKLSYDVSLDGTMNLEATDGAPGMLGLMAGLPLEIKVNGTGQTIFDTRAVDDKGVGTIAILVPQLNVKGNAFGTDGALDIKDGKAAFSLGGKAMGDGTRDVPMLTDPAVGLRISPLGHFEGAVPLKTPAADANAKTPAAKIPNAKTDAARQPGANMDRGINGASPMMFLNALPQLWPGRDIKTGETWTIEPKIPVMQKAKEGEATRGPLQMVSLGTLTMKLLGEETVGERVAQHIDVRGTLSLDKDKAAILNAANTRPNATRLNSARQTVNGDIWLDAKAGQIMRIVLKVQLQSSSTGTTPAKDAKSKAQTWDLAQDFNGTLQMKLGKVALAQATGLKATGLKTHTSIGEPF